jgi:hypothetical protein
MKNSLTHGLGAQDNSPRQDVIDPNCEGFKSAEIQTCVRVTVNLRGFFAL